MNDTKNPVWNKIPTSKTLKDDWGLKYDGELSVIAAKLFLRETGNIDNDAAKIEMDMAKKNPITHKPSTFTAF